MGITTAEGRYIYFRNCCVVTKEREKRLAKMCARSAKIDYAIYGYILHDLEIIEKGRHDV